jgi:hypothetical protein
MVEQIGFFFWRVSYNLSENGAIAVVIGLLSIIVLACFLGWAIRGFGWRGGMAASEGSYLRGGPQSDGSGDQSTGVAGFVKLCHSIRLNCWQRIQGDAAQDQANRAVLKSAYDEYQQQVTPWLSIILSTHHDDGEILAQARDAAAKCLSSIAGGLVCTANDDEADALFSQALQLAVDPALRREIEGQISQISSEKSASQNRAGARDESSGQRRFQVFERLRLTEPRIIVLGVALLIAIPILVVVINQPMWHPSVRDLIIRGNNTGDRPSPQSNAALPSQADEISRRQSVTAPPTPRALPVPAYRALPAEGSAGADLESVGQTGCTFGGDISPNHRPPNGMTTSGATKGEGHGTLKIINGNSEDAAVILSNVKTDDDDRLVYVRAGMTATLDAIEVGEYRMIFQIGRVWNDETEEFGCPIATAAFDQVASFEEHDKPDRIQYTEISITLHKLVGGNARTTAIARRAFHRRRKRA